MSNMVAVGWAVELSQIVAYRLDGSTALDTRLRRRLGFGLVECFMEVASM